MVLLSIEHGHEHGRLSKQQHDSESSALIAALCRFQEELSRPVEKPSLASFPSLLSNFRFFAEARAGLTRAIARTQLRARAFLCDEAEFETLAQRY